MFRKKYFSIMAKPDRDRKFWAFGLSLTLSLFIFVGFAFYEGFFSFGNQGQVAKEQSVQNVATAVQSAPSPISNTTKTMKAAFKEIDKEYQKIKQSLYDVMVPFFSNIEVYEK